jgi:cytochrome c553
MKTMMTRLSETGVLVLCGLLSCAGPCIAAPAMLAVCAECHGADGSGAGLVNVPILAGTPAAHLEEALYAYKDGARRCGEEPAMCEIAATLSDAEVAELAEYFASMKRIWAHEPSDPTFAKAGERLHKEHCAKCHVLPDDEDVENALGIPLQGQRSAYLRVALVAYLSGDRETLVPGMSEKLELLNADDVDALISYYSGYQP